MKKIVSIYKKLRNRNMVFIEEQIDPKTGRIVELYQNKKTGQNKIIH